MPQRGSAVIIFIIGIVIACILIIGGSFYIKNYHPNLLKNIGSDNNPLDNKLPEPTPKSNDQPKLPIAFIRWISDSPDKFYLYDLSKKEVVNTDPALTDPTLLGPYSPDGKYIPILEITEGIENPDFLYFYDISANKAMQVLTSAESFSLFYVNSKWIDNNTLIYDSNYNQEVKTLEQKIVTSDGKISSSTIPYKSILKNKRITIEKIENPDKSITQQVSIDGKNIGQNFKGSAVGISGNALVTLEIPLRPPLLDPNNPERAVDPAYEEAIKKARNEQEVLEILEKYARPKESSLIHVYSISDGSFIKSIPISSDGWYTIDAQIRPFSNTVVVHEQDKFYPPSYISRYTEIDIQNPDKKRFISQEPGASVAEAIVYGKVSFGISEDGLWLIGYQPSKLDIPTNEDKMIAAWNLSSGEKIIICEDSCYYLQVYNPEVLVRM